MESPRRSAARLSSKFYNRDATKSFPLQHGNDFVLQDNTAGYYVTKTIQTPKAKHWLTDLFSKLITNKYGNRNC